MTYYNEREKQAYLDGVRAGAKVERKLAYDKGFMDGLARGREKELQVQGGPPVAHDCFHE